MRILIIGYDGFSAPGMLHAAYFAQQLSRNGHQISFWIPQNTDLKPPFEKPLFKIEEIRFKNALLDPKLKKDLKHFQPQIIHIWTPRHIPARAALEAKYETKAALVIHFEDDEEVIYEIFGGQIWEDLSYFVQTLQDPFSWQRKHPIFSLAACRFADAFTAICLPYQERLRMVWHKPTYLLYPGVDLDLFNPEQADGKRIRELYGLENKKIVLYSGRLCFYHDLELLLKAWASVLDKFQQILSEKRLSENQSLGVDRLPVLLQVGAVEEGARLKAAIKDSGLSDSIILTGAIAHKKIPDYLAAADIFIQFGKMNRFNEYRLPSKIPEYMAMAKPMITFKAGFGRVLRDKEDALLTDTDEPEELAEKILTLLLDPDFGLALGLKGRKCAEDLFDLKKQTIILENLYSEILSKL